MKNIIHYISQLSFENIMSREELRKISNPKYNLEYKLSPEVKAFVNDESKLEEYEVTLKVEIVARLDNENKDNELFKITLGYTGLFLIQNLSGEVNAQISEEEKQKLALISGSTFLFPFVRSEIANITLKSAYAPILMEAIDFSKMNNDAKQAKSSNN